MIVLRTHFVSRGFQFILNAVICILVVDCLVCLIIFITLNDFIHHLNKPKAAYMLEEEPKLT
jgi:hypothetical protein